MWKPSLLKLVSRLLCICIFSLTFCFLILLPSHTGVQLILQKKSVTIEVFISLQVGHKKNVHCQVQMQTEIGKAWMRTQLQMLTNNLDFLHVWESRQHYSCFIFSVCCCFFFSSGHICDSKTVRETNPCSPLTFPTLCSLIASVTSSIMHLLKTTGYRTGRQGGLIVQLILSSCTHIPVNDFLQTPLPLLQGLLRAGGGSRVHILCVMFVWERCLPTFNTFPLHSSVLKPHFDLGDKKKIIICCLNLSSISRAMHMCVDRWFVEFQKKRWTEPHKFE